MSADVVEGGGVIDWAADAAALRTSRQRVPTPLSAQKYNIFDKKTIICNEKKEYFNNN